VKARRKGCGDGGERKIKQGRSLRLIEGEDKIDRYINKYF
jgi:hypothetical protein